MASVPGELVNMRGTGVDSPGHRAGSGLVRGSCRMDLQAVLAGEAAVLGMDGACLLLQQDAQEGAVVVWQQYTGLTGSPCSVKCLL